MIDSGSLEQEARDRIAIVGFAETERRMAMLSNDAACWNVVERQYSQLGPWAEKYGVVIGYSGMEQVVEDCIGIMQRIEEWRSCHEEPL